jgi:hypothetical protein
MTGITKQFKPAGWWTLERVCNGLRRYARDFFEGKEAQLPQRFYSYRNGVPEDIRRIASQHRLYPPYVAILRHFESLLEAWRYLGFEIEYRPNKNIAADIKGERFCWLTAIEYSHSASGSGRIWRCRCRCGKEVFAAVKNLFRGRVLSCGCYRRTVLAKTVGLKKRRDLTKEKFGRLQPVKIVGLYRNKHLLWECVCDCGNVCNVPIGSLTSGLTRSCGCLRKDAVRKNITDYRNSLKEKVCMKDNNQKIGRLDTPIEDYNRDLKQLQTFEEFQAMKEKYSLILDDAAEAFERMTEESFQEFIGELHKCFGKTDRPDDDWCRKYGAIVLPELFIRLAPMIRIHGSGFVMNRLLDEGLAEIKEGRFCLKNI